MARSFEERQVTEEIIDKEHRNVCIRWPNSSPCRIGVLLESRIQGRLFGSCRMTRHSYDRRRYLNSDLGTCCRRFGRSYLREFRSRPVLSPVSTYTGHRKPRVRQRHSRVALQSEVM
jgi:hypothetical protein